MKRRLLRNWLALGIVPIPPGMRPSGPSDFSLQALTSNTNAYAEAAVSIATSGTAVNLTPAQVLAKNIVLTAGATSNFAINLPPTSTIIDALGPTIPLDGSFFFEFSAWNSGTLHSGTLTAGDSATFIAVADTLLPTETVCKWMVQVNAVTASGTTRPTNLTFIRTSTAVSVGSAGSGTVTSVAQTVPPEFTIAGSPVTTTGTLAIDKATEPANTVWAGPTTGAAAKPTFRALVLADMPGGLGTGTVTSVGQAVPPEFTISGSPITGSGTLNIGKATETANTVWAGPTTGAAAQPTFRTLVLADLPGGVGSGTVTSVAATVPAEFTISGSPVTTSGTLAIGKANEGVNTVWAGPTSGSPGQPTFRALVSTDLPVGTGTVTSLTATAPIVATPSPITATGVFSHAASGVSASTYGDATHVGQFTVNATGHVTAASSVLILPAGWFTLTDGATITPDCNNGPKQTVTLGGNRTIAAPTNIPADGYELWLLIKQDGTGSRTATWNAIYIFFSSGAKTLSTGANAIDLIACVYNQADGKFYCQLSPNGL